MFAPPEELTPSEFARVPDGLRRVGEPSWMSARGRVGTFLEGPAFDREGVLHVVDLPFGRIFRVSEGGEFEIVAEYDGAPNGLAIHADGSFYLADRHHGIVRIDPRRGEPETVLETLPGGIALKGPNDLVFDRDGNLYFTDQGQTGLHDPTGRLVRLGADGTVTVLLDNIPSPNGLVLDEAERVIYLAVTRANAVWHVPLARDKTSVGRVGLFIQLSGGPEGGPDGMAMDRAGNLAVAHARLGSLWLFSALGEPVYRVRAECGPLVTNAAYGGPDGRTLFLTESQSGTILTVSLPTPGLPLFSHA